LTQKFGATSTYITPCKAKEKLPKS